MDRRKVIYGLVSGAIAVIFAYIYIEGVKERAGISSGWVEVLKAKGEIKSGDPITEGSIGVVKLPVKFYSPSMVLKKDADAVLHRRTKRRIPDGDYIFWKDLAGEEERVSYEVAEGKRLVALGVNEVTSLGFSIGDGDFVDLAVVSRGIAKVIIRDAKVKGLRGRKGNGYSTVLLELPPEDALSLLVALEEGPVYFLLKNPADNSEIRSSERRRDEIFSSQVEVIKGR